MGVTKVIVAFPNSVEATKDFFPYQAVNSPRLIKDCQLIVYKKMVSVRSEVNKKHRNLRNRKPEF